MLGIRATTENTVAIVRHYFISLVILALSWNIYNYILEVRRQQDDSEADDDQYHYSSFDIYVGALFATLLPLMVWFICILRAWQFHQLITQAERESEERRLGLTSEHTQNHPNDTTNNTSTIAAPATTTNTHANNDTITTLMPVLPSAATPSVATLPYGSADQATPPAPDSTDLEVQAENHVIT